MHMSKENAPKVTVIIPCYNREKFVKETIDSALSQDYRNIEVVAVDDGSTDATPGILKSYGSRIRVLEHPDRANKGQSAAINLAMRSTNGEYVAILDSDDVWEKEKIGKQVRFLEENRDCGLVYVNGFAMDEKGKRLYKLFKPGHVETNNPERLLLDCYMFVPSCSLVRRSAFESAGEFDEGLRSAQDHDMALRLAEITRFGYLDEALWYYRRHPDTQSGKHSRRRWDAGFRILDKACKRRNYSSSVRRKRLAVLNFRLGQCFAQEGKFLKAGLRLALAFMLDPLRAVRVISRAEKIL